MRVLVAKSSRCDVTGKHACPCHRGAARPRRGFTLMEVLATLVLIAIVIPVALEGISISLRAASTAKRSMEAVSLAETKLNELIATGEWQFGVLSGDFGQEFEQYRWDAEILQRDESADLSELVVHVTWEGRGGERGVQVATLIYTAATVESGTGTDTGGTP